MTSSNSLKQCEQTQKNRKMFLISAHKNEQRWQLVCVELHSTTAWPRLWRVRKRTIFKEDFLCDQAYRKMQQKVKANKLKN